MNEWKHTQNQQTVLNNNAYNNNENIKSNDDKYDYDTLRR